MAKDHEKAWREAIEAAIKAVGLEGLKFRAAARPGKKRPEQIRSKTQIF